jgi:hypothetical protein
LQPLQRHGGAEAQQPTPVVDDIKFLQFRFGSRFDFLPQIILLPFLSTADDGQFSRPIPMHTSCPNIPVVGVIRRGLLIFRKFFMLASTGSSDAQAIGIACWLGSKDSRSNPRTFQLPFLRLSFVITNSMQKKSITLRCA